MILLVEVYGGFLCAADTVFVLGSGYMMFSMYNAHSFAFMICALFSVI